MVLSFVACGETTKVEGNKNENQIEDNKEEEKDEEEKEEEVNKGNNYIGEVTDDNLTSNEDENNDEDEEKDENTDKNEVKDEENDNSEENNSTESEAINYLNYSNSRYGFKIQYPDFLIEQPAPENNDGRAFRSEDGEITLTASGGNNIFESTVESEYSASLTDLPNISYSNLGDRSYVVSWEEGDIVFYKCEIVGPGSINTFILEYPKARAEELSEVVGVCYDSFTAGDLESCH